MLDQRNFIIFLQYYISGYVALVHGHNDFTVNELNVNTASQISFWVWAQQMRHNVTNVTSLIGWAMPRMMLKTNQKQD